MDFSSMMASNRDHGSVPEGRGGAEMSKQCIHGSVGGDRMHGTYYIL